jgi:hypothetical protein
MTYRKRPINLPGTHPLGTQGLFYRYFDLLADPKNLGENNRTHIDKFEEQQGSLRRRLRQFKDCGCKPPEGGVNEGAFLGAKWIAERHTPTRKEIDDFRRDQAVAGGGAPTVFLYPTTFHIGFRMYGFIPIPLIVV